MCKNCICLLLHNSFSSLLTDLTLLSVGSVCKSQGLGIIPEIISFVLDLDLIIVTKFSNKLMISQTEREDEIWFVPIRSIVYLKSILAF